MAKATFISADQDWREGTTTYWFELDGADYGTEVEFMRSVFGVVEGGPEDCIVSSDNIPLTEGDVTTIAVRNTVKVTDELRQQALQTKGGK